MGVADREVDINNPFYSNTLSSINTAFAKRLGKAWIEPGKTSIKYLPIKDLPVLITKDGTIVCIPKLPEMGVIGVAGLTGYGKTLLAGYLIDNIYWGWGDSLGILNDSQEETFTWSEASDTADFNLRLKKLNQNPMPLPMIYLFPNEEGFEVQEETIHNKNYVVVSVPFEEVMVNIEKYIPDLKGSEKYLTNMKDALLKVESEEELFDVIEERLDMSKQGMADVKNKIRVSFKNLLNEGILNLSDESVPSELKVGDYSGNPFTAIMLAECIPSFITPNLRYQKHKDAIFSYYLDLMFEENKTGAMKGRRTWLYFDELADVVHSDTKKSALQTEKALTNIGSRGRNNTISIIYATQRYKEIPQTLRSQTKFVIIFRHKKDDTKEIVGDFGLSKPKQEEIKRLKKYEAMLVTSEYLVGYKENKKVELSGPVTGTILPPLHKNMFLRRK